MRGWARYWAMLYGFVLDQRERDPALEAAVHDRPLRGSVRPRRGDADAAFAHAALRARARRAVPAMAARLSQPTYYDPGFTPEEEAVIAEETQAVRERLDYA